MLPRITLRLQHCELLVSRYGGLFDLEAGKEGPEYASGWFRARLHYYKPHQLPISTIQQGDFFSFKGNCTAPTATMFLRTGPSLLDQFIAALPALDASHGGEAVLQCVPLQHELLLVPSSKGSPPLPSPGSCARRITR